MRMLANRFQQVEFDENEIAVALAVTPYTFAYVQNKLASYALAVVEFEYDSEQPERVQVIEHEKLKAQVLVLEELLRELTVPDNSTPTQS